MSDLQARFEALRQEMVAQFERTAAVENHGLMYTLLGWEHMLTCTVSHYLLAVAVGQSAYWPYVVLWLGQIFAALATIKLVTGRPQVEESPLEPLNKRIWTMFIFLCINVAVLNVVAGQAIFVFLPTLAVLSAFGFTFLTTVVSWRFTLAGLALSVTGILMASFPEQGFLLYGAGWLLVLQTLGILCWRKRRHWLAQPAGSVSPAPANAPLASAGRSAGSASAPTG
jgi:hypothetical protein